MKIYTSFIAIAAAALLLNGCASNLTGDSYSRDDAQKAQQVQIGTITYLRPVQIEGTKTPIGAGAGAVIGGIGGSTVGGGKGSAIAAAVGAVAGGLAGAAAEEGITRSQGVEVTVRLEGSNETVAIVQEVTPTENFYVGQRVRILSVNGKTRVSM